MKQQCVTIGHQDHDLSDCDGNDVNGIWICMSVIKGFILLLLFIFLILLLAFTYSSSISNLIASSSTLRLANGITNRLLARARRIDETEGLEMTFSRTIKTQEQADNILSITRSVYKPVKQRKYRLWLTWARDWCSWDHDGVRVTPTLNCADTNKKRKNERRDANYESKVNIKSYAIQRFAVTLNYHE